MIGIDAIDAGREIKKFLLRPKKQIAIFPKNFVPIQRKDGRMNFISSDGQGNLSYGEECDPKIVMVGGRPAAACRVGESIKQKEEFYPQNRTY